MNEKKNQTNRTYQLPFVTLIFHIPWFSSFLNSRNPLSMKSWYEPKSLVYRINWEIYTPCCYFRCR